NRDNDKKTKDDKILPPIAKPPDYENAAEKRREVNEAEKEAEDVRRIVLQEWMPVELVLHVVNENRVHAVEAEALPHLDEEKDSQPKRVSGAHTTLKQMTSRAA